MVLFLEIFQFLHSIKSRYLTESLTENGLLDIGHARTRIAAHGTTIQNSHEITMALLHQIKVNLYDYLPHLSRSFFI